MGILVQAVQSDDESTEEERRKEQAPLPGMTDEQEDTIVEHDVLQDREDVKSRSQEEVWRAHKRQEGGQGKTGCRQGQRRLAQGQFRIFLQ